MSDESNPAPRSAPQASAGLPYLNPIPFESGVALTDANFHLVTGFTCSRPGCSEDRYERDVSEWLTSPGKAGAIEAVRLGEAEVRLYLHEGRLVGFGAIGDAQWNIKGKVVPICLLHYFAVHTDFRHQPGVDRLESFGRRILGGLLEEVQRRSRYTFFALYVDPDNPAGRTDDPDRLGLYPQFGFQKIDVMAEDGRQWVRMIRMLP